jgi:uncharacterized protein (DUF302 family)
MGTTGWTSRVSDPAQTPSECLSFDRAYERIEEKLAQLGAKIQSVPGSQKPAASRNA